MSRYALALPGQGYQRMVAANDNAGKPTSASSKGTLELSDLLSNARDGAANDNKPYRLGTKGAYAPLDLNPTPLRVYNGGPFYAGGYHQRH